MKPPELRPRGKMDNIDGRIKIGDDVATKYGFTSDKFMPWSYLWKSGNEIWISAVQSREEGKGYFSQLLDKISQQGLSIVVPTPLGKMVAILKHKGFTQGSREFELGECGEVWIKEIL